MTTYSRTNGRFAAVLAAMCLVLAVLDGLEGDVALSALFGFGALLLGVQAMDDLVWKGSQQHVTGPIQVVLKVLVAGCVLWALLDLVS